MARYKGPRVRISRRFGQPIFGPSKYLERRNYGPGVHGPKSRRKHTDYGLGLIEKQKPYAEYLREVARHKIVFQLDRSRVPGQVAGDAILARGICVGGDGAIDRIAFPNTCGEGRTLNDLVKIASNLLTNTNGRATQIVESQWRAMERLSFQAIRSQLADFFSRL